MSTTGTAVELKRANKITAFWKGENVANAIFYKTHDKIVTVESTDESVVKAGFVFPEGTDEAPITAAQKLEAFKTFVANNSTIFGITYDPIDRRDDKFKYPSKFDEAAFKQYAGEILKHAVEEVLTQLNKNTITKLVAAGTLPEGTIAQYGVGEPEVVITENYSSGSIKYATAKYAVAFAVGTVQTQTEIIIEMVSGQLKKPRTFGASLALTMTGLKNFFIENSLLPKPEPKAEKSADGEATADTAQPTQA